MDTAWKASLTPPPTKSSPISNFFQRSVAATLAGSHTHRGAIPCLKGCSPRPARVAANAARLTKAPAATSARGHRPLQTRQQPSTGTAIRRTQTLGAARALRERGLNAVTGATTDLRPVESGAVLELRATPRHLGDGLARPGQICPAGGTPLAEKGLAA